MALYLHNIFKLLMFFKNYRAVGAAFKSGLAWPIYKAERQGGVLSGGQFCHIAAPELQAKAPLKPIWPFR